VGDILLADMTDYLFWEKGGLQSSVNPWIQWLTHEQAFKFTYRVDGTPASYSAITPAYGSNTQSPYIALAATT
jgi:HK97 family phage major capsid protein